MAILRGHPSHANKVQLFPEQRQSFYWVFSYFKTLSIGPAAGIEPATFRSAVKLSTDRANPAEDYKFDFEQPVTLILSLKSL